MLERGEARHGQGGRWRRPVLVAAVLLALLLVAALVAPGFVDWTRYKDRIAALAAQATGRSVTIAGPVSFRLLPSPALSAGDVTVANVPTGEAAAFAHAERLDIVVSLLPLLRGDVQVRRIDLIAPVIALERYADGSDNWHLAAVAAGGRAPGPAGMGLSIDALRIRRGHLLYHDFGAGRRIALAAIDARLVARSLRGPFEFDIKAETRGVPLAFRLRSRRWASGQRVPLNASLAIGDSEISYTGWLRPHDDAAPDGRGRLVWKGPDLAAFAAAIGRLAERPPRLPPPAARAYRFEATARLADTLVLDGISGRFGDTMLSGTARLDLAQGPFLALTLKADQFTLDPYLVHIGEQDGADGAAGRSGDALLPPALRLDLDIAVEALHYRDGVIARTRLVAAGADGTLSIRSLEAALPGAGSLQLSARADRVAGAPHLAGRIALEIGDLRKVAAWLGHPLVAHDGVFANAALRSAFDWTPARLSLEDATLHLDSTTAKGRVSVTTDGPRPLIAAALALDRLNLDAYLPTGESGARAPAALADRLKRLLRERPVDIGPTTLAVERLIVDDAPVRQVRLAFATEGASLKLERAAIAGLYGASFTLSGTLDAGETAPRADLRLRAEIPDLARLARWRGVALPAFARDLGTLALESRIAGTLDRLDGALDLALLGGKLSLSGRLARVFETAPPLGASAFDIELDFPDARPLVARLGLARWLPAADTPLRLTAHVEGDGAPLRGRIAGSLLGGEIRLDGRLEKTDASVSGNAHLAFRHASLAALARQIAPDYRPGAMSPDGLDLETDIAFAAKRVAFEGLSVDFGPAHLEGDLEYDRGGARPKLVAALEGRNLRLDGFLPGAGDGAAAARPSAGHRWSRTPWPVEPLRGVDADIRLTADRLVYGPYRLVAPRLALQLEDGLLRIEEATGGLFGGRADVAGSLDLGDVPKLSLAFGLKEVRLAPLSMALAGLRFADGRSGLEGSLTATGASPAAMVASLSGRAGLEARDGVLYGVDLPALARALGEISNPAGVARVLETTLAGGKTPFSRLAATIVARDGVIESDDLRLVHAAGDFVGRLRIRLPEWRVDGEGRFRLADYPDAPPIGLVVGGSLARPHVGFAGDALGAWITKRLLAAAFQPIAPAEDALAAPDVVGDGEAGTAPKADANRIPEMIMKRFLDFMRTKEAPQKDEAGGG